MEIIVVDLTLSVARLIEPNDVLMLNTLILAGEAVSL
jgi:hypothetical protein